MDLYTQEKFLELYHYRVISNKNTKQKSSENESYAVTVYGEIKIKQFTSVS